MNLRSKAKISMFKRLFAYTLISCLLFSCDEDSNKVFKIGVSQPLLSDSWRKAMISEMQRQLIFHNDIEIIVKDGEAKTSRQITQIQELIDEGIDLLIVSPNESEAITPIIESVYQRGIPVIVLDRRIYSDQYTAFIGADNKAIGNDAAQYIASILLEKGDILELTENQNVTAFLDRHQGFKESILKFPKISVAEAPVKLEGWKDYISLISEKKYDIILSPTDVAAFNAFQIADSLNLQKNTLFIGIDGLAGKGNGIELVSDKILAATFLYPTGGEESIQIASKILHGEAFEKENILNSTVIDRKNVRVMKLQSDKIELQQFDIKRQQERIDKQIKLYTNQRNLLFVLTFFLIAMIVMGSLAILGWREKSELNRILEAKKSEIEKQRDKITQIAKMANDANQEKINFFTNISHEFKTPLTLILAPIEAIISHNPSTNNDQIKDNAILIKQNALRLLRLVNQLMDFRKIEDKKMILHVSENDMISFIKEIMTAFEYVAKKRKIHFEYISTLERLSMHFDREMLDKVIFNLLSNAFKFTKDKGRITIKLEVDPEHQHAIIFIEDNGSGMSPETIEHAFDPFYSGDSFQGTGLGLSLSKELLELHHGSISISSQKGIGTRFSVILPLSSNLFSPDQIIKNPEPFKRSSIFDVLVSEEILSNYETSEIVNSQHEQTLLIIEDNVDLRSFLRKELSKFYTIEEASNGADGIRKAFETVPDVIVSDVMLPGKSGFEVVKELKNDLRTSHIPIIILTAKAAIEERIEGIQTGADEYIAKPFVLEFLKERIKALIKTRDSLKEHYSHDFITSNYQSTPASYDKKFLNDFRVLVEKNVNNPDFNVNEIGPELAMSRVQIYRKVKALLGCSVNDYIVSVRLKRAQFLLINTDKSIAEISTEVGFSSPNYFSTAFKGKFNLSPKEFKNANTSRI